VEALDLKLEAKQAGMLDTGWFEACDQGAVWFLGCLVGVVWALFRAIIRLFCDLQSARHWLFRPLAQVIHPPKFIFEPGETTRKTP
jgi:hypothetical protein